jgi:surfactin synthase thioesterase subunit
MNGLEQPVLRREPAHRNWVVAGHTGKRATLRLFCFPYAGGGAGIYRTWQMRMPSHVQVCAVQLPGRGGRLDEASYTRLAPLVSALTKEFRAYLDLPFALFGHSMGALLAFELARDVRSQLGVEPVQLFVSGHRSPKLRSRYPAIHQLPEAQFRHELECLNGTPAEILQNTELMDLLSPMLRADFAVTETYSYSPGMLLSCPISAYLGADDPMTEPADLLGWREETSAAFEMRTFPGDHFYLDTAGTSLCSAIVEALVRHPGSDLTDS